MNLSESTSAECSREGRNGANSPVEGDGSRVSSFLRALRDGRVRPSRIAIDELKVTDSPRLAGEDDDHCRVLAELSSPLPPIVVLRATMGVIDGVHRLRAAVLRGEHDVDVQFFEGSASEAFLLAVRMNAQHGLPLSRADRNAAAARILASHPQLSDRSIAAIAGLAPNTVGAIRRRAAAQPEQLHNRVGRDGRVRPINSAKGRELATRLVLANPDASLRTIAKAAGISPGTVRAVRRELDQSGCAPTALRSVSSPTDGRVGRRGSSHVLTRDVELALQTLKRDPSLRFTEAGRGLLRLLEAHLIGTEEWEQLMTNLPPHCLGMAAELASSCAKNWQQFAELLAQRHEAATA